VSDSQRREHLEGLFIQHAAAVKAYALRRIDAATADETVSEVFVIAWRRLDDLPSDPLPWLLACARRVLANQRRAGRRQVALEERLSRPQVTYAASELDGVSDRPLARALGELSSRDRELLLLVAWEELEPEQTARALGCSRRTLAVRLHRARRRLADLLQQIEHEEQSANTTTESLR
jgi:RNA polymerase sigma-70 factor (ECF subfamily)